MSIGGDTRLAGSLLVGLDPGDAEDDSADGQDRYDLNPKNQLHGHVLQHG